MPQPEAPSAFDSPRTTCPLCDRGPLRHVFTDFRGHGVHACGVCGVEFMNPQYSDDALRQLYDGYIQLGAHAGEQSFRSRADVRQKGKHRSLQLLARYTPGPRVLMVGCGDGLELREAKACGFQPEGFDVDERTTQAVAASEGVPVHCGDFHGLPARTGAYDAVFLDQVIEHPKDPGRYLQTCCALLRPGGVMFLGMPNLGSISNRWKTFVDRLGLRGKRGRHYNTRHHVTFFTPRVLVRHLRDTLGLEVLRVRSSLKPQKNPVNTLLNALHPVFDSSFLVVARVPVQRAKVASAVAVAVPPAHVPGVGAAAVAAVTPVLPAERRSAN